MSLDAYGLTCAACGFEVHEELPHAVLADEGVVLHLWCLPEDIPAALAPAGGRLSILLRPPAPGAAEGR